jgi:hypothetical protein
MPCRRRREEHQHGMSSDNTYTVSKCSAHWVSENQCFQIVQFKICVFVVAKKTKRREYVFLNFLERLSAQCLFKQKKIAGVTGFFGVVKG